MAENHEAEDDETEIGESDEQESGADGGEASGGSDHRAAPRARKLKGAFIVGDDQIQMKCIVRDISETGAKLKFDGTYVIPKRFKLVVDLDGFEVDCERVRMTGLECGARFIGDKREIARRKQGVDMGREVDERREEQRRRMERLLPQKEPEGPVFGKRRNFKET